MLLETYQNESTNPYPIKEIPYVNTPSPIEQKYYSTSDSDSNSSINKLYNNSNDDASLLLLNSCISNWDKSFSEDELFAYYRKSPKLPKSKFNLKYKLT